MKVIGYLRVSTSEQGESGLGIEAQAEKVKAYCSLYDLELVEMITDTASGKNLNRSGLDQALEMMNAGEADGIIIAKLDRLTRSVKDMGYLLEKYFQDKFALHVVAEQVNTTNAAGRLVLNVLMSVAQWERETIGERTKDALQAKRQRGEKTGGKHAPYGYDADDNGKLTENSDEQAILRMIERLRNKGYTYQAIADQLNKDGYVTRTGKQWRLHIVRKMAIRKAA